MDRNTEIGFITDGGDAVGEQEVGKTYHNASETYHNRYRACPILD